VGRLHEAVSAQTRRKHRVPFKKPVQTSGLKRATVADVRISILFLCAIPAFGQARANVVADAMLARLRGIAWGSPKPAGASCSQRIPVQLDIYATTEWTHHCSETSGGIVRESFYYVFGEPARTAELRVDVRPEDESPEATADLLRALRVKLTARFGNPDHAPELMEIGFRRLRYGQPVAGDHWHNGSRHFFLHANQTNLSPMGMRRGAQLVVMDERLMQERERDEFIHQVDGLGGVPDSNAAAVPWKTPAEREQQALQADRELTALLREAGGSSREDAARRLLAADALVSKLGGLLLEPPAGGEREAREADSIRRKLAGYGVKLGHQTHNGGLAYGNDLLWRVWREYPGTEAGETAFLDLLRRGWNTDSGEGCPKNPDLFRDVIEKGEAFLAQHPQTRFRKEIAYAMAVAYESWWSIAHAPADDAWVNAPPYPRREINARQAAAARLRAIQYYREVVRLAPESPEAASALRRLPRLELGLDTGQRRFFCSYC
jgi:hypothetical protein